LEKPQKQNVPDCSGTFSSQCYLRRFDFFAFFFVVLRFFAAFFFLAMTVFLIFDLIGLPTTPIIFSNRARGLAVRKFTYTFSIENKIRECCG